MKIKLAILEKDQSYLNRIVTAFSLKYADKFEIYSFTDVNIAMSTMDSNRIDVFIASDIFDIDTSKLPKKCGFAYFIDSADVDTVNGHRAICKYQKADLIYKQILSIYSENAGNVSGLKFDNDSTKIVMFEGPSGGVGASTVAASCATYLAAKGKKTLYLNLERFGTSDAFFEAEGQFNMSDLIFALKSKKTNLAMKLESCVKHASNGVYFYSQSKLALDMMELSTADIERLITELKLTGSYDFIILDVDFSIDKESLSLSRQAHSVVWVSDGSETANIKLYRAFTALSTIEQNSDSPVSSRVKLIYNKFSNKTGKVLSDIGIKLVGGVPRFEHTTTAQVMEQLSKMDMFEKIM